MAELSDFFGTPESNLEEINAKRNQATEDRFVKAVLTHFGLQAKAKELQRICYSNNNNPFLTFSVFHDEYPSFPILLKAVSIPYLHNITFPTLFKNFGKSRIFDAFMEFSKECEDNGHNKVLGVIFPCIGFGPLLVHNSVPAENGLFITFKSNEVIVCVSSWKDYLNSISWSPY